MKTYKIKLESKKYNVYYFLNGEFETKEFHSTDGINGTVRDGYILDFTDSFFTKNDLDKFQFNELKVTDWYFVRKVELDIEVPVDVIEQRLDIRKKYDNLKKSL